MKRRRISMLAAAAVFSVAGLAIAQQVDPAPPQDPGAAEGGPPAPAQLPAQAPEGASEQPSAWGGRIDEFEQIGIVAFQVQAGTRWQIERSLQTRRVFVVFDPAPPDLKAQVSTYGSLSGLSVEVEREGGALGVVRLELQARHGSLAAVAAFRPAGGAAGEDRGEVERASDRGVVPSEGVLTLSVGQPRRLSPKADFCRFVRQPLPPPSSSPDPISALFEQAEGRFEVGDDAQALKLYGEVARSVEEVGSAGKIRSTRAVSFDELAALRLADVQVCLGQERSALLRYEMLKDGQVAPLVRLLAGFEWVEQAWPAVEPAVVESLLGEVSTVQGDPLVGRVLVHAARVQIQRGEPRLALDRLASLSPESLSWASEAAMGQLKARALLDAINAAMEEGDDVGLVTMSSQHKAQIWAHPLGGEVVIEVAGAMRRLGLPELASGWIQESMEGVPGASEEVRLLGELARAYRESGDLFRAEQTVRYLAERLGTRGGWLGRREEIAISMAAAEVALDGRQWGTAAGWLERAEAVEAGPAVTVMLAYVKGRARQEAGDKGEAASELLKAGEMRRHVTPYRRAQMCLEAAEAASAAGRGAEGVALLRAFMAEVEDVDEEIEVAFALAGLLKAEGDAARAQALYEDVALRQPEGTWGLLAQERAAATGFEARHRALLEREGR